MYKAEQFQTLTKQYEERQLQKSKRIQSDIKFVEDALENLYMGVKNCIEKEITPPKYAEINKILEKEVSDDLILNQGFFLEITNNKYTRIYYNKNDFDNRTILVSDRNGNKIPYNQEPTKDNNTSLNEKQREFLNKQRKSNQDKESHLVELIDFIESLTKR